MKYLCEAILLYLKTLLIRFHLELLDGNFWIPDLPVSLNWVHVVLNYIGPDEGTQGTRGYLDGELKGTDTVKFQIHYQPGNARVVVGKDYTDLDTYYASVGVDDLFFFNQKLSDEQILLLKTMV